MVAERSLPGRYVHIKSGSTVSDKDLRMASYVVSDIHGCIDTLKHLVERKLKLSRVDTLYCLGDFIDRGPGSKQVLDYMMELRESGYLIEVLLGNHEEMFLNCFFDRAMQGIWYSSGGSETLKSFEASSIEEIPERYIRFISDMERFKILPDYLLVHAGFNFEIPDIFSDEFSMLWIRNYIVDPSKTGGRIVVHGHTPTMLEIIKKNVDSAEECYRITIDNGAVYSDRPGMGSLVAMRLEDRRLFVQANVDL